MMEEIIVNSPSDGLTGFDFDDMSIWGTKTRIEDLTPENVAEMWSTVQRYRREIQSEAGRATAIERENKRLKAALKPFASLWGEWWNRNIIDVTWASWFLKHANIPLKAFEDAADACAED